VLFAIVAALAIAGVFSDADPDSQPQSYAPTSSEPATTKQRAPVVVVPGAGEASAADVERAKARAREAAKPAKSATSAGTGATPAATAVTPPPAATPGATAPPPPPPPPATKAKPTGKGSA